jgi:hypothetical protein
MRQPAREAQEPQPLPRTGTRTVTSKSNSVVLQHKPKTESQRRPRLPAIADEEIGKPEYLAQLARFSSCWQICHFHVTKIRFSKVRGG